MIRKLLLLYIVAAAFASAAASQGGFTTVTGTIVDPNLFPYACSGGTISAQLITAGGAGPTLNGLGFSTVTSPVQLGCITSPGSGANGSFAMRLADSGVIVPGNTQWKFTVNMSPGITPPMGTGPQSFSFTTAINCSTNTPATCTSNTIDISTQLNALAPALTRLSSATGIGVGGGSVTSVSAGNLSPLFTTLVSTPSTTPSLAFTLTNAGANTVFGNCTGSTAPPSFCSITAAMLPAGSGTVSSVGLALPPEFLVSGSPVTSSGTLTGTKVNQPAGTVWAGPSLNSIGGSFDGSATATANASTTISITMQPSTNHDWGWFITASAPLSGGAVTMNSPWVLQNTNGNAGGIFTQKLTTTAPVTGTATYGSSTNSAAVMFLLQYVPATTPSVVQGLVATGGLGNGSNLTFSSNTTIGNNCLVAVFTSGAPLSGGVGSFTDSQANNWTPLVPVQNGASAVIYGAITCALTQATTDTITFHTSASFGGSGFMAIYEVTNVNPTNPVSAPPVFTPIANLLAAFPTISTFTNKNLSGSVAVTLNTLTTIDSVTVTMPATGGPWRARVNYTYYKSGGVNYNCYITDGTIFFAPFEAETTGNVPGCFASAMSTVTYANGAVVTFTAKIFDTGSSTITQTSNVHTPSAVSAMQVEIVSSN
jgi:hypothetical protein